MGARFMRYTTPSVTKMLDAHGLQDMDVLWVGNPRVYSLASLVRHRLLVYRLSDDLQQSGAEPRTIGRVEQQLCEQADMVFATAGSLVAKAQQYTRAVRYLPNGVDFEHFAGADVGIPKDLAQIPQPRVLYVGTIGDWFDFDAMMAAANELTDCSFVLVGPLLGGHDGQAKLQRLGERPNVFVLGPRPFQQIPAFMHHSQVGLIPFLASPFTHAINPIKLFEYCSAGLPVVSRRLAEIESLKSPGLLYDTPAELVAALRQALASHEELGRLGVEFGRANTWEQRYREVRHHLERLMEDPRGNRRCLLLE